MMDHQATLRSLLDRATTDPEFLEMLAEDPLKATLDAGVQLSSSDLKRLLGLSGATDMELVEVIQARVINSGGEEWLGCGGR